jgi:RNA polymerase sigma-70 factor (ECF subfamily)
VTDDASLLRRWADGDRAAGGELIDRWFVPIGRFFRNKVADDLAVQDDLVQATFAALLEAAPRYRGEGSFRAFLFSIAFNMLRKHYDRGRRDAVIDFGATSVHDLGKGPFSQLAERGDHALVLAALRELPIALQTALELSIWEGLTAAEIGIATGEPEGTIKTRLRRAKALLREKVEAATADPATRAAALASIGD